MIALLLAIIFAVRAIDRLAHETVVPKIEALTARLDQVVDSTHAIADNVKDTTTTVSTTTGYVAEQVVAPVIRIASLFAGVRAAGEFLARRGGPSDVDKV
jgi:ABC-type transporter Mla subunit MlaD